ncbi:hypothetical protein AGMMS49975_05160 [Clostridia bacterium]|nr:hypothetical protein AGMMS49975_05160 [Clostridia bacterium]
MKGFLRTKRVVAVVLSAVLLSLSVPTYAAVPQFTNAVRDRLIDFVQDTKEYRYDYDRFAVYDLDGDGIPEVLMGKSQAWNPKYISYDAWKFDSYENTFHKVGYIESCRYLVKDRFSYALLGFYGDKNKDYEVRSYYMSNSTLHQNVLLQKTAAGTYTRNKIAITAKDFNDEIYNYYGNYDEVIVHDQQDEFNFDKYLTRLAVYSWRPNTTQTATAPNGKEIIIAPSAGKLTAPTTSTVNYTKQWQKPMQDFIDNMIGPKNTLEDEWAANPTNAHQEYTRYTLFDLDGDNVPEILMGVNHDTDGHGHLLAYDVYKYNKTNGIIFVGNFNAYSKYLSKVGSSVFSYDPVRNSFYAQSANLFSYKPDKTQPLGSWTSNTLLAIRYEDDLGSKFEGLNSAKTALQKITEAKYINDLSWYVSNYTPIKTWDAELVPSSSILLRWRPGNYFN